MKRIAALAFLLAAPVAQAATITVDKPCYQAGQVVTVTGQGFAPNGNATVFLDKQQLGTTLVTPQGVFQGRFPIIRAPVPETSGTLAATDGANSALTTIKTATPFVSFSPNQGNPKRLRVRFRGNGFGGGKQVYLHYVLHGKEVKRVALAKGEGECGSFNAKRKLLPFRFRRASYTLQYDTSAKYNRSTPGAFKDSVRVFRRFS